MAGVTEFARHTGVSLAVAKGDGTISPPDPGQAVGTVRQDARQRWLRARTRQDAKAPVPLPARRNA